MTTVVVCLTIFLLKTLELTIESLRLLLYIHGRVVASSILASLDVLLNLAALAFVVSNLTCWPAYVCYAAGYSLGNLLGYYLYTTCSGAKHASQRSDIQAS